MLDQYENCLFSELCLRGVDLRAGFLKCIPGFLKMTH